MKLILCKKCQDVFKLSVDEVRTCKCGACRGQYKEDGLYAWYSGKEAVPLFFVNYSLVNAIQNRPEVSFDTSGKNLFTAGVIEYNCETLEDRTDEPDEHTEFKKDNEE